LKVEIPEDRLCPPVCIYIKQGRSYAHALTSLAGTKQVCSRRVDTEIPPLYTTNKNNRLNYILWLQDLLDSTTGELKSGYDSNREVIGLDMYVSPAPPA
jgi:23S rRNA (adenine1618-N6)-methyltransferase